MIKEGQRAQRFTLPSVEGGAVALKVKLDGHAESVLDALRGLGRPSEA